MNKPGFPSWPATSLGAKLWHLGALAGPPLIILFSIELFRTGNTIALLVFAVCSLGLILYAAYMAIMWLADHKGFEWVWRLALLGKKLRAMSSKNPGELWLNWAREAEDEKMARLMAEMSAKCWYPDGLYEWGRILKIDKKTSAAAEAFLAAAKMSHPVAAWEMGEATRLGLYQLERDPEESRRWHETAARAGYVPSIRALAMALDTGDGLNIDQAAAFRWQKQLQAIIKRSGTEGSSLTAADSGAFQFQNTGRNEAQAKQTSVSKGIADANTGTITIKSLAPQKHVNIAKNKEKTEQKSPAQEKREASSFYESIRFLKEFAQALSSRMPNVSNTKSFSALIWMSLIGLLFAVLYFIVMEANLYVIAAIPAIFSLMWLYYQTYNPYKELDALRKRAAEGEITPMYELGMIYLNGSFLQWPDMIVARQWLMRAAEKDHHAAMMQLGRLLLKDPSNEKDMAQARYWLERAKNAGIAEAYHLLLETLPLPAKSTEQKQSETKRI